MIAAAKTSLESDLHSSKGNMLRARVIVTLKQGVLDPQGKAIEGALASLSVEGINNIRQGKVFDISLAANSVEDAENLLRKACEDLLANTVIENYSIEFLDT